MQRLGMVLTGAWLVMPKFALAAAPTAAEITKKNLCEGSGGTIDKNGGCNVPGKGLTGDTGFVMAVTNTLIYVAGAVAVVIIITAGIRYITSAGDAARVKASKDTLLYAVVGLIVVILAYAIVNFVATRLT
ncbi:MAG TPA: pilin [Candidatus Polarisedimenticolaceae bacterium]|nr:pilin [Candidatus Polarisedimenticolaceae bacterium]